MKPTQCLDWERGNGKGLRMLHLECAKSEGTCMEWGMESERDKSEYIIKSLPQYYGPRHFAPTLMPYIMKV